MGLCLAVTSQLCTLGCYLCSEGPWMNDGSLLVAMSIQRENRSLHHRLVPPSMELVSMLRAWAHLTGVRLTLLREYGPSIHVS